MECPDCGEPLDEINPTTYECSGCGLEWAVEWKDADDEAGGGPADDDDWLSIWTPP